MTTNNFSWRRIGMLLKIEFIENRRFWSIITAIYFLAIALLLVGIYYVKLDITEALTTFTYIAFIISIFTSKTGYENYTKEKKATTTFLLPTTKCEKYITTIILILILPIIFLFSLPICYISYISNEFLNNIGWYVMLVSLTFTINFMNKSYFKFIISFISSLIIIFIYISGQEILNSHFHITLLIYTIIIITTLISSWYLFKNYSIKNL